MRKFIAIVIALVALFAVSAMAEGKWVTEGDTCYWLEDGLKSQAHKHTEEALIDYITKYEDNTAIVSECPTCHQKKFKVEHLHQLYTVGPVIWNAETYWKTGNYVIEDGEHWYYSMCTVEGCDFHSEWSHLCNCQCDYSYDADTDIVTRHCHCMTCDNEWDEEYKHKGKHHWYGWTTEEHYKCIDSTYHQWVGTETCYECGATREVALEDKLRHTFWLDDTVITYVNGKVYRHLHCYYCGYDTDEYVRECDHKAEYVTFTYKPIENSDLCEKICNCCGATVDYVVNNNSNATGYIEVPSNSAEKNFVIIMDVNGFKIRIVVPIDYENKNDLIEGEFTTDKLCYVAPYSEAKGVTESTVFTGAKFWGIDDYGNVTYELITSDGLIGFAHEADINW